MSMWQEVNPEDVPIHKRGRRGRVSYPLVKSFMESNLVMAKLDPSQVDQPPKKLKPTLGYYIKAHQLPIKLFVRDGDLYMMRLDLNADGTPNPDYEPPTKDEGPPPDDQVRDFDDDFGN